MKQELRDQMLELRAGLNVFNIASKLSESMERENYLYLDSEGKEWTNLDGKYATPLMAKIPILIDAKFSYVYPEDLDRVNREIGQLFQWNPISMLKNWFNVWVKYKQESRINGRGLFWKVANAVGSIKNIRLSPMSYHHLLFARVEYRPDGMTLIHSVITDRRMVVLAYRRHFLSDALGINRHLEKLFPFSPREAMLFPFDYNKDLALESLGDLDLENSFTPKESMFNVS